jgi:HprK-related kinase A
LVVGELAGGELRRRLTHAGLRIRLGPVVSEVRSRFGVVRDCIRLHYAAHEVAGDEEFADFRVSVQPEGVLRQWVRSKAVFRFEDTPPFQPLPGDQAFALLEWGLNWAIAAHCHQFVMVHSAVVERSGRAMLLPAPPGSGKSTLCAGLVARGWRLLSDELALIDLESRAIVPLPRPISLKNRSIGVISDFWPGAPMSPVVHDTTKGDVVHVQPPASDVRMAGVTAHPGWVVLPHFEPGEEAALGPLGKGAALMHLIDNAFNYSTHGRSGFECLADVVQQSTCVEFTYGGDLDAAVQAFDALAQ